MARGWESKGVELQVESNEGHRQSSGAETKASDQQLREHIIRDLQLSRTRITNDLASATNPNHRKSLEAALAYLNQKISELS